MRHQFLSLCAALLLAACSSSTPQAEPPAPPPADPPVAGTQVPTSATTTSDGATRFVSTTSATPADNAEPLEIGEAQLASSDTGEPSD